MKGSTVIRYTYHGEEANLRVLLKELEATQELEGVASVELVELPRIPGERLGHGPTGELLVSVGTSFLGTAAYEALAAAVRRARARGRVDETVEQDEGEGDAGASPT